MRLTRCSAAAVIVVIIGSVSDGCRKSHGPAATAAALQQILASKPVMPVKAAVWADVRELYKRREGGPLWVKQTYTSNAENVLQVLRTAWQHGLKPADYGEPQVRQLIDAIEQSKTATPDRARQLAELILGRGLPAGVLLNVNVPLDWNGGVRLTRQSAKLTRTVLQEGADPRGRVYYWLTEEPVTDLPDPESDYAAVFAGHVSVTPIELERTHEPSLNHLSDWADLLQAGLKR